MFKNLSLKWKFTLIMVIVGFFANLTVAIGAFYFIQNSRKQELMHEAKMVLYSEKSARDYTAQFLRPAVSRVTKKFVMQAQSATFVALGVAKNLKKFMPDYVYTEAALNPLNLKDLATPFQKEIINKFKADPSISIMSGFHSFNGKSYFYIMKPVIAKTGCLACHGIPSAAPAAIVSKFGDTHGFGWKVGHVIGALSVVVPTKYIDQTALKSTIIIGIAIFILPFIALIIALYFINKFIIKPIHEMTKQAEEISIGKSTEDFKVHSNDEIGTLAKSFNRLKRSYLKAVEMLTSKKNEK